MRRSDFDTPEDRRRPSEVLDEIITEYVDRLNRGESLDLLEVIERHPEVGEEVLDLIYAYVDLGPREATAVPFGTFGDYVLRREIGRGGMGVVYEAWESSMARSVALKILLPAPRPTRGARRASSARRRSPDG